MDPEYWGEGPIIRGQRVLWDVPTCDGTGEDAQHQEQLRKNPKGQGATLQDMGPRPQDLGDFDPKGWGTQGKGTGT